MRMKQSVWVLTLALGVMGALGSGCHESRPVVGADSGIEVDSEVPRVDAGGGINVDEFDRSCVADDDCEAVFVGSPCGCSCEVSAVNGGDYEAYLEARRELRAMCGEPRIDCVGCPEAIARCAAGVCVAGE